MPAPVWKIVFEEGSDFELTLSYEDKCGDPIDVTGYGAELIAKNDPDGSALVTATVSNSRITVSGTTGQFAILIPAASITAIKNLVERTCQYTVNIWPTNASPDVNPKRLLQGPVTYTRDYA